VHHLGQHCSRDVGTSRLVSRRRGIGKRQNPKFELRRSAGNVDGAEQQERE
jgi:hypothetical protein